MPLITHYEIEVEVHTVVRNAMTGRRLISVTTSGESKGDSAKGLTESTAPALAEALAAHAVMVDAYGKGRRSATA